MELKDLQKPFDFKWKIQSFNNNKTKGACVAYIDARDVEQLLDKVCGAEKWQNKYYEVKGTMCAMIGIKIDNEWIWKSDGGAEISSEFVSSETKTKGELSDAFKRAAVKWGIGRFLYKQKIQWVKVNENKKPVDDSGKVIWDLTKHINAMPNYS